jgi:hypothetical protein
MVTADDGSSTRFDRGNRGGPGNPFGPRVALLRLAFLNAITPEDVKTVVQALILKASTGDMSAAKLLLQYSLGKPVAYPGSSDFGDFPDSAERENPTASFADVPFPTETPASLVSILDALPTSPVPPAPEKRMSRADRKAMYREMRRQRRENAPSTNGSNGAAGKTASDGVAGDSKTPAPAVRAG